MSVANCILWSTCTDEAHTVMCGTSPQGCRVIHPSQTKKSLSQIEIRFLRYVIILGKKKQSYHFSSPWQNLIFYITEHWWIEETEESFTFFPPSEGQHLAKYFQTADSRYLRTESYNRLRDLVIKKAFGFLFTIFYKDISHPAP